MRTSVRLLEPKPDTQFVRYEGHLALFHLTNQHSEYWRGYWQEAKCEALVKSGIEGSLGEFESLIERYVPRHLPILEAGCGPGHLVAALRNRGYSAIGIDYEAQVVDFANQVLPQDDIREGNILALDFATESLGCYLSVGVVEHFQDGPEKALAEARRVVHPEGVALISVPYLNPYRAALLADENLPEQARKHLSFHQYYFSQEEFGSLLSSAGFEVVEMLPYSTQAFLVREHPVTSRLWSSRFNRTRFRARFRDWFARASKRQRLRFGHMIMAACRPQKTS